MERRQGRFHLHQIRGERRRVDAVEAIPPRQLHCICHFDQRSHGSLPHCRCGRYRCGQGRHVHEARPAAPVGAQGGFQRCRAGQVVHEWRHRYERHVQGCQLQRGHWQLGHELGDHHGGHVQRRQLPSTRTCPRGTSTRSVPPAPDSRRTPARGRCRSHPSPPAALHLPFRPTESRFSAPLPLWEIPVWSRASRT